MLDHAHEAYKLAEELGLDSLEVSALRGIGKYYNAISVYDSALIHFKMAMRIAKALENHTLIGRLNYDIGTAYMYLSVNDKAVEYFSKALSQFNKNGNERLRSRVLNALGGVYYNDEEYTIAITFFQDAITAGKKADLPFIKFHNAYNNIGLCYSELGKADSALYYIEKALEMREEIGLPQFIAESYLNIGYVLIEKKSYRQAITIIDKAIAIQRELGDKSGEARSLNTKAYALVQLYHPSSILVQKQAIKLAMSLGDHEFVSDLYHEMGNNYKHLGQTDSAYHYLTKHIRLNDSISSIRKEIALADARVKYNLEKIEQDLAEEKSSRKQADRKNTFFGIVFVFVLVIATIVTFAFVKIVSYNQELKRKNTEIETQREEIQEQAEVLLESNEEVTAANEALTNSQKRLARKNKEVNDSINYATKIQRALLVDPTVIERSFPDFMLLYHPKDHVSGDVYWYAEIDGKKLLAVVDCTGHGIPGAFVSMVAISLLDQITKVEAVTRPDLILNYLHKRIRLALKQKETNNHDGMDIAICSVDQNAKTVEYAGAKSPLFYFKEDQEPTLIKGDRMPIGGEQRENERIFTLHLITWEQSLRFYMYSDGYQDQFGGENSRKYSPRRFRNLLENLHHMPMPTQSSRLDAELEAWMGTTQRQIDDIIVLGVDLTA